MFERFASMLTLPRSWSDIPPVPGLYKFVICAVMAGILSFIVDGIYNTSNHRLAAFPGPTLAAATSWYKTYFEVFRGASWIEVLEELHKKYGKIVRVGPNELHFSDPEAYDEIYNDKNKWDKEESLYHSFGEDRSSFGFLTYAESKKRTDIMNPLFSRKAISDLQGLVQSNVDRLCEVLTANNKAKKSSDLFFGLRCFTLDTITSFCFSKSADALGEPDFKAPIIEAMEATLPTFIIFRNFDLIRQLVFGLPASLIALISPQMAGLIQLQKLLGAQVKEVRDNPTVVQDAPHQVIFHELQSPEANQGGKIPTAKSLYEEAQALTFFGADSTGNALMLGTFHLLEHPGLIKKLKLELLEIWPVLGNAPPRFEQLEKLPFLTAVIKESLRIGPGGIVSPLPRIVPKGGATISGTFVPHESVVGMAGSFVHNSESIFKDPKKFDPTRWLGEDATSLDKWLVAFSKGPRMCMGQNLAYCELYLAFASLFRRFDLELDSASGHVKDLKWRECFLPCFQGPHLRAFCRPVTK